MVCMGGSQPDNYFDLVLPLGVSAERARELLRPMGEYGNRGRDLRPEEYQPFNLMDSERDSVRICCYPGAEEELQRVLSGYLSRIN